ncbi:toll-like receptor 13 [Xenopus laevis]|uniref:Toll-like receptor 13 n=2 Tax=Xenopus laevis TaxID=8355 RepID=A0A1L8GXN6_XENLA|nr:toll-like receptor 13 [Xenopus laevis]XP_041442141.1 toll-like receptor 13 [Xenopus laevis]XP_041442142.1 toll-like receptor 13 [Xenopus laevis]OCT88610.1 hypothetical protein XELAEV_18017239mg [Xenopus laevis]
MLQFKMLFPLLNCLVLFHLITRGGSYAIKGCEVHGQYNLKVLCYNRNLTKVPTQLPPLTFELDLSHNNIKSINRRDFQNLTIIQKLNISNNNIEYIENGTFANLAALELLNLTRNMISSLSRCTFEGLQNLSTLLLDNNNIVTIEPKALSHLFNLQSLSLSFNSFYKLKTLNPVFQLESLKEINIANCSLQSFSTEDIVKVSPTLHSIDASRNPFSVISFTTNILQNLTTLDVSFSQLPILWYVKESCFLSGLKKLNIKGNNIKPPAIMGIIKNLSCSSLEELNLGYLNLTDSDNLIQELCLRHLKLQTLKLTGNQYTEFKKDTFQNCTFIKVLDLSHNRVHCAPGSTFQHLTSIRELSLANNSLVALPDDLPLMASLQKLNLSYNHLTEVNFKNSSSNLKELDLSGNKMTVFLSSTQGNWSLQDLNLRENYLLDISTSFASSLSMLQRLTLSKNKLSSISTNTFQNLTFLKHLNLADNQIEVIDPGAFNGLDNLYTLIMGSNKITRNTLHNMTFQGLGSLHELQLFGNYLNYDSSNYLDIVPFFPLKYLRMITLNSQGHNGMQNLPINFFEGLVALEKIHAGNLALSSIDSRTFSYTPHLRELDISENPFKRLDPFLLKNVQYLTELHLSQTRIETLDFLIQSNMTHLQLLRAVGSQLNSFTAQQYAALPSLRFLDLQNNPLTCNCDNQWFIDWVHNDTKTQVLHFYEYTCAYPPAAKNTKLSAFNISSCRLDYTFILFLTSTLFIMTFLISATVWNFWRWHLIYAYYITLAYVYNRKWQGKKQKCKYDAFISYNCHDEKWVFSQLVPNLEGSYNWRLCLHHRDFEPGKAIVENIVDGIYSSRKTICIISRHYLESEWCSKEIQLASFRLFEEHTDVLILLFLEQIPDHQLSLYHQIRKLIKKKTYLIWPQERNATCMFWYRVNQALQTEEREEDPNCLM